MIWRFTKNSSRDIMHEQVHCCDEAANHQLPIAAAFWIIQIVSVEECWSLMQNLMHSLLYLPSCFECDDHTVLILTQRSLPPPLTSSVKPLLSMHGYSSPLSLAARLYPCRPNYFHINNGSTFLDRLCKHIIYKFHILYIEFIYTIYLYIL